MEEGYEQTLSGLLRKRASLAAGVVDLRRRLDADLTALEAIDGAILVFNPALVGDFLPLDRVPVVHQEATSELRRFLIDLLRQSESGFVRTLDATQELMRVRQLDPRDRVVATLLRKRVTDGFTRMRKAGIVVSRRFGSGVELEWRLKGRDEGGGVGDDDGQHHADRR